MTSLKADLGVIPEDFWYSAPERKHLLLGKTRFSEVDAAYAAMSEEDKDRFRPEIPVISSIRWSGMFLEWKEHLAGSVGEYPRFTKETRKLAHWVQRNRRTLKEGKLSDERKALLDQGDPLWQKGFFARSGKPRVISLNPPVPFHERLEEYSSFVSNHGRLPSKYSADPEERRLNFWMTNQKYRIQHVVQSPSERMALIDTALPGHLETKRQRTDWDAALELFVDFITMHDRYPSPASSNPRERFIGRWISTQRESRTAQRDKLHAERAAKLDAAFPEWRNGNLFIDRDWNEKLEHFSSFVVKTGRMPTSTIPEEKAISTWRSTQLTRLRRGTIAPHRLALLNEKVPGWDKMIP